MRQIRLLIVAMSLLTSINVLSNGVTFKMIKVEGGTFQMGSTTGEWDEGPVHSVTLSTYYIAETEVTQGLWKTVMNNNPSTFIGDDLPVQNVSWNDCQTFITKLNQMTGRTFTLPTEAQWEFAARGGANSLGYSYCGSDTLNDVAWYDSNSENTVHIVGTKVPNELGIYDMFGNVWEWCDDYYGEYSSEPPTNPTGPSSSSSALCYCRVYRGGSWCYNSGGLTFANRNYYDPNQTYRTNSDFGLRLALTDANEQDSVITISTTPVDAVQEDNYKVFTEGNYIVVTGASEVCVCDASGKVVYNGRTVSETFRLKLPMPGVYFVVCDNKKNYRIVIQ